MDEPVKKEDFQVNLPKEKVEEPVKESEVTGMQIFNLIVYFILSLALLIAVLLYFPEISLSFHPAFGWIIAALGLLIFLYSMIQLLRLTPTWVKSQSPMAIILASLIFITAIVLLIVLGNPFSILIESKFSHTQDQIAGGNLSAYLGLGDSEINTDQVESRIHELINEERTKLGLNPLSYDPALAVIAEAHTKDMIARNYFSHNSPEGTTAIDRGNNAGYDCTKNLGKLTSEGIAENLALTPVGNSEECGKLYTGEHIASCTVTGWMNSPAHKKNIITETYDKEGIGVERIENEFYITQNFC